MQEPRALDLPGRDLGWGLGPRHRDRLPEPDSVRGRWGRIRVRRAPVL